MEQKTGGADEGAGQCATHTANSEDTPKDEWVQCDRCAKWRCVPRPLFEGLSENDPWYCRNNPDAQLASCDAPQAWTNEMIDQEYRRREELGVDCHDGAMDRKRKRPAIWQLVKSNIYTHRRRKLQREDDIMICQCKARGGRGCVSECINRLLNLECVPGYCPCGDACLNQIFSRRQYANLEVKRAGLKGFGLYGKEDIKAGQFVIEYIGEVLEDEEYARRKEFYAATGQRHYYFMNIGNGEVIDACRKGNLGRFINHSCEPNCETQKWLVQGELAIGLFATRDIKKGDELTFDYNFERYGDRPMQCYCGTPSCRGYIGGSSEVSLGVNGDATGDADDASDDPEPIMVTDEDIDPALGALLNKGIGLEQDNGCDAREMRRKLERLFSTHGVHVSPPDSSEDDESWLERELNCMLESMEGRDFLSKKKAKEQRLRVKQTRKNKRVGKHNAIKLPRALSTPGEPLGPASTSASNNKVENISERRAELKEALTKLAQKERAKKKRKGPVSPTKKKKSGVGSTSGGSSGSGVQSTGAAKTVYKNSSRAGTSMAGRRPVFQGRRSEIDRRLDDLVGPNGRLIDHSRHSVIRVLRLFNLCDIGQTRQEKEKEANRRSMESDMDAAMWGRDGYPASHSERTQHYERRNSHASAESRYGYFMPEDIEEVPLTVRQKARVADLSLLLDVVIKTVQISIKKTFVQCGVLSQLQQVIGRNFGPQYNVIVRKILKAVDSLPFTSDDFHSTRSANGTFACLLHSLSHHKDPEVRKYATSLTKKHNILPPPPNHQFGSGAVPSSSVSPHDMGNRFPPGPPPWQGYGSQRSGFRGGLHDRLHRSRSGPVGQDSMHMSMRMSPRVGQPHRPLMGNSDMPPRGWKGDSRRNQMHSGSGMGYMSRRHWENQMPRPNYYNLNRCHHTPPPGPDSNCQPVHPPGFIARGTNCPPPPPPHPPPPPPPRELEGSLGRDEDAMDLGDDVYDTAGDNGQWEDRQDSRVGRVESGNRDANGHIGCKKMSPVEPGHSVLPPGIGVVNKSAAAQAPKATPHSPNPPVENLEKSKDAASPKTAAAGVGCGSPADSQPPPKGERLPTPPPRTRASPLPEPGQAGPSTGGGAKPVKPEEMETLFAQGLYGLLHFVPTLTRQTMLPATESTPAPENSLASRERPRGVKRSADEMRRGSGGSSTPGEGVSPSSLTGNDASAPPAKISRQNEAQDVSAAGDGWTTDHWDEPNGDFEAFVSHTLKRKLGKYLQDDHPRRISREAADRLYKRLKSEVILIERQAFEDHQKQHTRRPIERRKLESNIKEFVKQRVYRLHERGTAR